MENNTKFMPTLNQISKEEIEKFDETFGVGIRDEEGDLIHSEGRTAGCDDCYSNLEQREEYREFLISSHLRLIDGMEQWAKSAYGATGVMIDQRERRWVDLEDLLQYLQSEKETIINSLTPKGGK